MMPPGVTVAAFAELGPTRALGIDRAGDVWLGADAGVFRFDGRVLARVSFAEPFGVRSIAPGPPGVVYLAAGEGLLRMAGGEHTLLHVGDTLAPRSVVTSPSGEAYLLATERTTQRARVFTVDGLALRELAPGVAFPPDLAITCLGVDGAGALVLGAAGALALRDEDGWKVFRGLDPSSSFAPAIDAIAASPAALWLGSPAGVYEYRGGTFALHRTEHPVSCLAVDGDELWIGMRGGGLGRLRAGVQSVVLPDADVAQLARGADGRIWVLAGGAVGVLRGGEIERVQPAE